MSTQAITSNAEASILVRILQADEREITPELPPSPVNAIAGRG